jgi:hypothetical protein
MREMIGKQRRLLERKKTHTKAIRQKLDVKIAKLIFESSVRYRKMGGWLLATVEVLAPAKAEEVVP